MKLDFEKDLRKKMNLYTIQKVEATTSKQHQILLALQMNTWLLIWHDNYPNILKKYLHLIGVQLWNSCWKKKVAVKFC